MQSYTTESYQQLFVDGNGNYPPDIFEENADHYSTETDFFEWWYFDVVFPDGSWFIAVFHSALYCLGDHKPTIDLRYYHAESDMIISSKRFSRRDYEANHNNFYVRIGSSWACEKKGKYLLHIQEGDFEGDLEFNPTMTGLKVGSGRIFENSKTNKYFKWIVPIPSAKVKGTLRIKGREMEVGGVGYHDHNWGNIYLPSVFRGWIWGRLWAENWTVVFADLVSSDGKTRVTPLLIGKDEKVFEICDSLKLRFERDKDKNKIDHDAFVNDHMLLESKGGSGIIIRLKLDKMIDSMSIAALRGIFVSRRKTIEPLFYISEKIPWFGKIATSLFGAGYYHRWSVNGSLNVGKEEVKVKGIVEGMKMGQKGNPAK